LNWKLVILSNWKLVLLLIQLGLIATAIVAGRVMAEPIDDPVCPG
jgi:hypothetical protein